MRKPIIIVSGLPRSGTSMLLRMLDYGGVPVVADNIRNADQDNPLGYYEDERVKNLRKDNKWINKIHGKAVKIISLMIYEIPPLNHYRVIFMHRKMEEILLSQKKMLFRKGQNKDEIDDIAMARKFYEHLQKVQDWLKSQKNIVCLYLNYQEVVADPVAHARKIAQFLEMELDTEAMAQAVDKSLHRSRAI